MTKETNQNIKGYKYSPIGMIPSNWEVYHLEQLGEFKNGINKSKEDFGFGVPFINLMDVFGKASINANNKFDLVNATKDEVNNYSIKKGDVLFIRSSVKPSGVGLTAVVEEDLDNIVYSGFIIRFREFKQLISLNFKKYLFHEKGFRQRLMNKSSVSANTNINQESLNSLEVALPPIDEQNKISQILCAWDLSIEILDNLIRRKEKHKKYLMQKLLSGEERFEKFKKEAWNFIRLDQITDKIGDGLHGTPKYTESSEYYFVNGNNLIGNSIVFSPSTKRVDKGQYEMYKKGLNDTTILFSINGTIGNVAFYQNEKIVLGKSVAYINCKNDYNKVFLFYYLSSEIVKSFIDGELTGSTIQNLSLKSIRSIPVPSITIAEQSKISGALTVIDNEINLLKFQLIHQIKQKKGLMDVLLTGKIKVKG